MELTNVLKQIQTQLDKTLAAVLVIESSTQAIRNKIKRINEEVSALISSFETEGIV